jgi:hypothetical protein
MYPLQRKKKTLRQSDEQRERYKNKIPLSDFNPEEENLYLKEFEILERGLYN